MQLLFKSSWVKKDKKKGKKKRREEKKIATLFHVVRLTCAFSWTPFLKGRLTVYGREYVLQLCAAPTEKSKVEMGMVLG